MLDVLTPFSEEHGGPLRIEHITFVEGRGNLIITYPGKHIRGTIFWSKRPTAPLQ